MNETTQNFDHLTELLNELIEAQKKTLLKTGRRIIPTLTPEDMLQPNDYESLENNAHFRYEEGILAGMQSVQMAFNHEFRRQR